MLGLAFRGQGGARHPRSGLAALAGSRGTRRGPGTGGRRVFANEGPLCGSEAVRGPLAGTGSGSRTGVPSSKRCGSSYSSRPPMRPGQQSSLLEETVRRRPPCDEVHRIERGSDRAPGVFGRARGDAQHHQCHLAPRDTGASAVRAPVVGGRVSLLERAGRVNPGGPPDRRGAERHLGPAGSRRRRALTSVAVRHTRDSGLVDAQRAGGAVVPAGLSGRPGPELASELGAFRGAGVARGAQG